LAAELWTRSSDRQLEHHPITWKHTHCVGNLRATFDGDRDPTNAGSVGEAVDRGGSMAEVGMTAIPFEAHQVSRHMADREAVQLLSVLENAGRVLATEIIF
jgi:hypothetical protein